MYSLRLILIVVLGLSASSPWLSAVEPDKHKEIASTFRLIHTLKGHHSSSNFKFSPDGKLLASAGDTSIRLWDTATGKEIQKREMRVGFSPYPIIFMQEGRVLACGDLDTIYLLDVPSLELRNKVTVPKEVGHLQGLFRNGKILAGSSSTDAVLWDLATGKKLWNKSFPYKPIPGTPNFPNYVSMSPDVGTIAVGLEDATVAICDAASGKEQRRLVDRALRYALLRGVEFSPTGKLLAVGMGMENRLQLWNVATGKLRRTIHWGWQFSPPGGPRGVRPKKTSLGTRFVTFSSDGKTVAAVCEDNKLRLWEIATGGLRQEINGQIWRADFSPDNRLLATGHPNPRNNGICLWDWRRLPQDRQSHLSDAKFKQLWRDLSGANAAAAHLAIAELAASPQQTVDQVKLHSHRVEPASTAELNRLVAQLDDEDFTAREKATKRLAELGMAAKPKLREALAHSPSPELRRRGKELLCCLNRDDDLQRLRWLRSVELLEYIGTSKAREVLERIASGASGNLATEDARRSLKRLERVHGLRP